MFVLKYFEKSMAMAIQNVRLYSDIDIGNVTSFLSVPHKLSSKTGEINRRVNCIIYNSTAVRGTQDIT